MNGALTLLSALAFAAAAGFAALALRDAHEREALEAREAAPAGPALAGSAPAPETAGSPAPAAPDLPRPGAETPARLLVAALAAAKQDVDWPAKRLLASDPAAALEALRASWPSLPRAAKVELLRQLGWLAPPSPAALDILDLGMADSDPAVLAAASGAAHGFALVDFEADPAAWSAWRAAGIGRSLDQILDDSAADFLRRLRALDSAPFLRALRGFNTSWPAASRLRQEEVEALVLPWLAAGPGADLERATAALGTLGAGEPFVRARILPLLDDPRSENAALRVLSHPANRWATPLLLARLDADHEDPWRWVQTLEEIGDPRAVGPLISRLQKNEDDLSHDINEALETLAGVESNDAHDSAWWAAWWERNGDRFPAAEK